MTLAFVTSAFHRSLDEDLPFIVSAAEDLGIASEIVVWDDPDVDWAAYDAVVVRSCWDYISRRDEFLSWAASVPHLHNTHEVVRWNTDKIYLQQLQRAAVPVIDTRWDVAVGDDIGAHDEWVVKPTISSGAKDTARWHAAEQVWAHSAELIAAGRRSMTQPYISSVDDEGETALIYFSGEFSHAIGKGPLLGRDEGVRQDRDGRESITPRTPRGSQRELAEHVLSTTVDLLGLDTAPLYARVDVVTAPDGSPLLMELELTEPSLFLPHSDGAADRLLRAVTDTAASRA